MNLLLKGMLGGLGQVAFLCAVLFIPAGTLDWPRATQFLAAYGIVLPAGIVWLVIKSPESLAARFEMPEGSQPKADRIISIFLILAILTVFLMIPIDVFHLHLFPPPAPMLSALGAAIAAAGFGILMVALRQNPFAVSMVKNQQDKGHHLIDTGLYDVVRHPFYTGLLLFLGGITLWLESYAALLALGAVLMILVGRILVEEKTLRETLPGYIEYMKRVRYRIVPLIW